VRGKIVSSSLSAYTLAYMSAPFHIVPPYILQPSTDSERRKASKVTGGSIFYNQRSPLASTWKREGV
jgi:hypothetical protein